MVDRDGTVLDVVPRARMRAERLRHRCTFIALVDSEGRLVVHQRAPWKDIWPGRWDIAFGGVVAVGEQWDDAAARELAEEAGVEVPLTHLGEGTFDDDHVSLIGHVYVGRHDGSIDFADGEVVAVDRVPFADLDQWLTRHETTPDSVALVGRHVKDLRS